MKQNLKTVARFSATLLGALLLVQGLTAQTAPATTKETEKEKAMVMEAFVTTGSNIRRLDQESTLPVTVFSMAQLETRDASTPADLLIGIPEITNIPANETSTNAVAARGDNANVALRGLGTLNTLILLNGRRMPVHPLTSSAVNVNTLPTFGLQQVEVLRDGASAIYGSDAVAGVVNYVTAKKPQGSQIQNRFMFTQHGGGMEDGLNIGYGRTFAEGKGSYTMSLTAFHRDAIYLREREFSSNTNRLKYARAPWNVAGQGAWDGSTSIGRWAQFIPGTSTANTASRWFYPTSGVATDTPSINTVATPRGLYENYNDYTTGQPRSWRTNLYNRVDYDFTPTIHAFFDSSFYLSRSFTGRQPITLNSSDSRVFLGINNPYNPVGSRFYSPTGAPNADGSARLTGAPQQATMTGVFMTDGGAERLTAFDSAWRMLAGVGGSIGKSSWKWEAAIMSGSVYANDESKNAVRDSYLRAAAQRSDATAWNPFGYTFKVQGGSVVADQKYTNPLSVQNFYTVSANRFGHSKLTTGDLGFTGNLFELWAGPIAASTGIQWLYSFNEEHKDPYINNNPPGSIGGDGQPLDPINNDVLVTSPKFDYSAGRVVASAFAETVIPLASHKKEFPLIHLLNLNASVRYERYSDFGGVTKPKYGVDYRPVTWLLVRASENKGFRAPILSDLYQPASFSIASPPGNRDAARNNFFVNNGQPADLQILTRNYTLSNSELKPENSTGRSFGLVVDVPKIKGLSFTVDYWEIRQNDLIFSQTTTAGLDEKMLLDYTQAQLRAGKSILAIDVGARASPFEAGTYVGDPYLLRAPVTPADVALFQQVYARAPQSTWIAPAGQLLGFITKNVNSKGANFTNGFDLSASYNLPKTPLGQFRISSEWSTFLNKYTKTNPGDPKNDDVEQMLVPKWRGGGTIQWRNGPWDASANITYQSDIRTGATATATQYATAGSPGYIKPVMVYNAVGAGTMNYYEVGTSATQINTAVSYRFGPQAPKWIRRTAVRIGINNLLDEEAPYQNVNAQGYSGGSGASLWVGRAFSISTTKEF